MASSSSSSFPAPTTTRWKYDVFLSFRGEDTRYNFVDHLCTALKHKGINVFKDDEELERGREISPELVKAIEESKFSIIVFSENYASSSWCLDELVKIIDCTNDSTGHMAFPIFYNVDPSNVRKQKRSFAEAFAKHENSKENMEKMQRWRIALSQAATLSGWDSRNRHESKFIQDIVEDVYHKLNSTLQDVDKNLVGIDSHLEKLDVLLSSCKESKDVKFVGIYGLGGIGKTTIAKAVYDRIFDRFEGCSYLVNVREESEKNGLVSVQKQLLYDILKVSEVRNFDLESVIKNRLCRKRVLILLDDVVHLRQLKKLAGEHDWFGPGSRVIITTRDEHLLVAHGVDEKYKVGELDRDESLKLFRMKAFKLNHPQEDYMELTNNVVNYAKGLPLALTVLGSSLCGRNKMQWKSALEKLKKFPDKDITDTLKISYDGLEQIYKDIFLDIACFFKAKRIDYVTKILDSCGFPACIGIQVLIDRSLISLSDYGKLLMHDLVQDMGRDIVFKEGPNPSKRSRLWLYEDIRYVLMNNVCTEAVEAIMLEDLLAPDEYEHRPKEVEVDLHLSDEAFVKMYNLRLLIINGVHHPQCICNLPSELKILHWESCPLEYLPSSFQPGNLVGLIMRHSRIEKLWNGIKASENLRLIDLRWSEYLIEIPDLTGAPFLEQLILDECENLFELHPSVGFHRRLKYLSLRSCTNLRSLPSSMEMESLETLDLHDCKKLGKLPNLGKMECLSKLDLEGTAIREVPSSIENITGLKLLNLSLCKNLTRLPNSICRLKNLEELLLRRCSNLKNLPENLGYLESLVKLDLSKTAIKNLPPSSLRLKNLQSLSFEWCRGNTYSNFQELHSFKSSDFKLHSLFGLSSLTYLNLRDCGLSNGGFPSDIGRLSSLETLDLSGNDFVNLPSSISRLSRLTTLRLVGCNLIEELPWLPSSIGTIIANECRSLRRLSNHRTLFKPTNVCFGFVNCLKMVDNGSNVDAAFEKLKHQALFGNSETVSICLPGDYIPLWFSHQNTGCSVSIPGRPSIWYNKKLRGLAFCAVAIPPREDPLAIRINLPSDGEMIISKNASATEILYKGYGDINYAHMMLGYISRALLREIEEDTLKATFNFTVSGVEVESCGIRLIYDGDEVEVGLQTSRAKPNYRHVEVGLQTSRAEPNYRHVEVGLQTSRAKPNYRHLVIELPSSSSCLNELELGSANSNSSTSRAELFTSLYIFDIRWSRTIDIRARARV